MLSKVVQPKIIRVKSYLLKPVAHFSAGPSSSLPEKITIFGGNGYVGQRVSAAALRLGLDVISISRSGAPSSSTSGMRALSALEKTTGQSISWMQGDAFAPSDWREAVEGSTGVVSCIGAFGSNEHMLRVNGDVNARVAEVSSEILSNDSNFVYISTVENNLPDFILRGYFEGKQRAEEAVEHSFPSRAIILRPPFVYGTRDVGSLSLPLGLVGRPLEMLLQMPGFNNLVHLPGMRAALTPPVSVEDVGLVAAAAAAGRGAPAGVGPGIKDGQAIREGAARLRRELTA
jgi:uncharacterized protein YbjT (DUF2867 family)